MFIETIKKFFAQAFADNPYKWRPGTKVTVQFDGYTLDGELGTWGAEDSFHVKFSHGMYIGGIRAHQLSRRWE